MKNLQNQLLVLFIIILAIPRLGTAQDNFNVEINRIYPFISMPKDNLSEVQTIGDLNTMYKPSWVKEYISVEVTSIVNGKERKAIGKNETFNAEQKQLMEMTDEGKDISIKIKYLPNNTLSHNDIKEINFVVDVDPKSDAQFSGGQEKLKQYLKKHVIEKISAEHFLALNQWNLAAIKFTVDEEGQIINPDLVWTSKDESIDALLMETIQNMPKWKPAEYANGLKVKQEFAFTVGNHKSCVVNMVNIRRDKKGTSTPAILDSKN